MDQIGGGSVNNNPNPNPNSAPKSRHQPKTQERLQLLCLVSNLKSYILVQKVFHFHYHHRRSEIGITVRPIGNSLSMSVVLKNPVQVATTSQTSPSAGGKFPNFDPNQSHLKPVMQKHKSEPPTPEPPSHKFQLRKAPYRDGPKGWNAHNSNTDKGKTECDPFTSRQKKSPGLKPHLK
ncbi:hypothetical protein BASA83_008928 [Batrachochytrium salamandrivorans]|nr:hypothetical protein BASA83_008928 [Batrachochytrium salamandrivorans]